MSWAAAAVLLAAALLLLLHFSANVFEFSSDNPDWNGTSRFFSDLDRHRTTMINEPGQIAALTGNATLLIIAPNRVPSPEELSAYRAFLGKGNTIILADDFGTGNRILRGIGSHISVKPGNLSSIDRVYADPFTIVVYRSSNASSIALPETLLLDRAAALDGGTPLMESSIVSWIDINGDGRLNTGEEMGTFPVMTYEETGGGELVVLSDPSIFINSMYVSSRNDDNRILIRNIVNRNGTIAIDQMNSRTSDTGGISEILHMMRTIVVIRILIFSLVVMIAVWAWRRKKL